MTVVKHKVNKDLFVVVYDGVQYKMLVPATFDANQDTEIVPNHNQDSPVTIAAFNQDFEGTELEYTPEEA